jgi:hypothetical protein
MEIGIIYLNYDNPNLLAETRLSLLTLKKWGLKSCLITNHEVDNREFGFDLVIQADLPFSDNKNMGFIYEYAPFDINWYVDSDVYFYGDPTFAIEKCKRHSLCLTHSPLYHLGYRSNIQNELKEEATSNDLIEYQAGWVLFIKNESNEKLFKICQELSYKYESISHNQQIFSLAVEKSNVNPFILTPNWNFRGFHQYLHGDLKCWHNHWPPPESEKKRNISQEPKIVKPLISLSYRSKMLLNLYIDKIKRNIFI